MISYEDRKRLLLAEFELIDTDHDYIFSKADLIRYLDRRNGGLQFDRHLANELFDRMEKDKDDRVSVNEFLNIWSECHEDLETNIMDCDREIAQAKDRKTKLENEIKRLKERAGGASQSNSLRVIINEARSVNVDMFTIMVKCNSKMSQTSNFGGRTNSVQIAQYMEFDVPKGDRGNLYFQLLDVNSPAKPPLEGAFSISMLEDQLKHEEWITLQRIDHTRSDARLSITMQHLWSEEVYYQNVILYWDNYIKKKEAEKLKNQTYLKQINNPNDFLLTVAHGDFYIKRLRPTQDLNSNQGIDSAYRNKTMRNPSTVNPIIGLSFLLGLALIITCLLGLVYRTAFESMAVGLLVIGFFYLELASSVEAVLVTVLFDVVAIIMNVVWLILYWRNFWSGDYIDSGTLERQRGWLCILSLVMIGIEVVLLFLMFRIFWFIKKRTTGSMAYSQSMQLQGGPSATGTYNQTQFYRPGSIDYFTNYQTDGFFIERPMGFMQQAPGTANKGIPTNAPTTSGNPIPIQQQGAPPQTGSPVPPLNPPPGTKP